MKRYKVKINDKLFEVEVEEVFSDSVADTGAGSKASTKNEKAKKEERAARPHTEAAPRPSAEDLSGEKVVAPLPGDISIKVNKGDTVEKGDLLFILEAMKMENEITAPAGGMIKEIFVAEGGSVESGDVLAVIE